MKRLAIIISMLFVLSSVSAAVNYSLSNQTGSIPLNAFINEYVILRVDPISSEDNPGIGMPFDITGTDVDYANTVVFQGRKIADWAFATNCSTASLKITTSPLTNTDEEATTTVNYYMTFSYKYITVDENDNENSFLGYIQVNSNDNSVTLSSGNESVISYNSTTQTINIRSSGSPVISMDCDIRIRLHSYTEAQKDDWNVGYYYGTVQFEFSGE